MIGYLVDWILNDWIFGKLDFWIFGKLDFRIIGYLVD